MPGYREVVLNFYSKGKNVQKVKISPKKSKRNRIYKYFFASCSGDVFFCHEGQSGPLNSVIKFALDRT